ncbi:MAG TPA: sulfurtransferase-like selenium metabolism protein YedF [Desulfovibrio sp.]|uniref:sulfurtransferase-like selenium metabolism protein YedF n=1 Tax=Nitratidesulfovibrio vulgaris TaxID=881 RepID=UPI000E92CC93|nr:sulfurtransferase-like selenium metabolism protein YedF [Nitratidesulfovibrio vulgaris]HBW14590.1 sulfurtransferase-like selenium metabolism protein YedF [Desulfovibrio sp.]
MPEITLNCQKLPCPQPVLRCKALLDTEAPARCTVTVDNAPASENVARFLTSRGYDTSVHADPEGLWNIIAVRKDSAVAPSCDCEVMDARGIAAIAGTAEMPQKVTVFITSETLGSGDDVLGGKLMTNFLATLPELGDELWRIVCVNGGVRLATREHPAVTHLNKLEAMGVDILVCGTCLDHFGLLSEKAVGQTTNMLDVVTSLQLATKVIRP